MVILAEPLPSAHREMRDRKRLILTCLNIINQGDAIWQGGDIDWSRFMMNYAVPFLVASYSGAKARKSMGD